MYKKIRYNTANKDIYKRICLRTVFFSKIKTLILSTLNIKDRTIKNKTIAFENAKGFPNIKILLKLFSGSLIAHINIKEYAMNMAYNPKNFFSKEYDFGGSLPSLP